MSEFYLLGLAFVLMYHNNGLNTMVYMTAGKSEFKATDFKKMLRHGQICVLIAHFALFVSLVIKFQHTVNYFLS